MKTVKPRIVSIRLLHRSNSPYRGRWCEPIGWTPVVPPKYRGKRRYIHDGGSIWDPDEEVAGTIYVGPGNFDADEGAILSVPRSDVVWARTGNYKLLGQA